MKLRPLSRSTIRSTLRRTTRMLISAREPDWLSIYCDLYNQILKIDQRLRPFMQHQTHLHEQHLFEQQLPATLQRVYGPDSNPAPSQSR